MYSYNTWLLSLGIILRFNPIARTNEKEFLRPWTQSSKGSRKGKDTCQPLSLGDLKDSGTVNTAGKTRVVQEGAKGTSLFLHRVSLQSEEIHTLEQSPRRWKHGLQREAATTEIHRPTVLRGRGAAHPHPGLWWRCTNRPGPSQNVARRPFTSPQGWTITSTAQDGENTILSLERNLRLSLCWLWYKGAIHRDPGSSVPMNISFTTSELVHPAAPRTAHQPLTLLRLSVWGLLEHFGVRMRPHQSDCHSGGKSTVIVFQMSDPSE